MVAPDSPQSGMGHAITISDTLYCKKEKIDNGPQIEYSISGTPADCVNLQFVKYWTGNQTYVFLESTTVLIHR